MFCPRCGRKTDKLIDGLCPTCYFEERLNLKNLDINLKICKYCGVIYIGNAKFSKDLFKRRLSKAIKDDVEVNNIEINEGGVKVRAFIRGYPIDIILPYQEFVCPSCMKKLAPGKKRMIIQLRGDFDKFEEVINDILKRGYKIVDYKERKEGLDIYLDASMIDLRRFIAKYRKLGVDIKITRKLMGYDHQHGKKLWRVTISFRL